MNKVNEEWRDIAGYEGLYMVSNTGEIKSLVGWNGHKHVKREKILQKSLTTTGYYKIELTKSKDKKSKKVHRLVAAAFIPAVIGKEYINHKDGNPLNNFVENLEWCTQKENINHAYKTGLKKSSTLWQYNIINKYTNGKETVKKIAEDIGVSNNAVLYQLHNAGIDIDKNRRKYILPFDDIKKQIKNGEKPRIIAEKYGCPSNLISTLKYKWKKEGVL